MSRNIAFKKGNNIAFLSLFPEALEALFAGAEASLGRVYY